MSTSNTNGEDARDLETALRQDLGLLEWQIRDIMPFIETRYILRSDVVEAINQVDQENDSNGRYNACVEIRAKLGLQQFKEEANGIQNK